MSYVGFFVRCPAARGSFRAWLDSATEVDASGNPTQAAKDKYVLNGCVLDPITPAAYTELQKVEPAFIAPVSGTTPSGAAIIPPVTTSTVIPELAQGLIGTYSGYLRIQTSPTSVVYVPQAITTPTGTPDPIVDSAYAALRAILYTTAPKYIAEALANPAAAERNFASLSPEDWTAAVAVATKVGLKIPEYAKTLAAGTAVTAAAISALAANEASTASQRAAGETLEKPGEARFPVELAAGIGLGLAGVALVALGMSKPKRA